MSDNGRLGELVSEDGKYAKYRISYNANIVRHVLVMCKFTNRDMFSPIRDDPQEDRPVLCISYLSALFGFDFKFGFCWEFIIHNSSLHPLYVTDHA